MPASHSRVRERIERVCGRDLSARDLRIALLEQIGQAVPFDAHAWLLTDPVTRVGTSPLAALPGVSWDRLPDIIRLKYLTTVNRWTGLTAAASLHRTTAGDRAASPLWNEVQSALGIVDVASVVFTDRCGCWGFLDLWRARPGPVYAAAEIDFLDAVRPVVTAALRGSQARTFESAIGGELLAGPAVLLLGADLRVRLQTPSADNRLRVLNPPPPEPGGLAPIPAAAYNVGAQLIAAEQGIDPAPPRARVHLNGRRWVTLDAARVEADDSADIAVVIEETSPADRLDLFARTHALSTRETEVFGHIAAGAHSKDMATALFVSEHTVNDHVKSILAKSGTTSRQQLISRALGTG